MIYNEYILYPYELYLAEQSMLECVPELLSKCINENNVTILSEGVKETIENYLNKVTTSMQNKWDTFKQKVNTEAQQKYLRENSKIITNFSKPFTINEFPNYTLNNMMNIKVIIFDYNRMKNTLETKQDFLENSYKQYISRDYSFKQMIERSVLQNTSTIVCEKKRLFEIYNYLLENISTLLQSIEQDISTINTSNNTIMKTVSTIVSTEESYNLFNELYSYITEAPKMSFTDANGEKTEANGKKNKKHSNYVKSVYNYMKVSTDIISTKMKIVNDVYKNYYSIIQHAVEISKKKETDEENDKGKINKKTTKTNVTI